MRKINQILAAFALSIIATTVSAETSEEKTIKSLTGMDKVSCMGSKGKKIVCQGKKVAYNKMLDMCIYTYVHIEAERKSKGEGKGRNGITIVKTTLKKLNKSRGVCRKGEKEKAPGKWIDYGLSLIAGNAMAAAPSHDDVFWSYVKKGERTLKKHGYPEDLIFIVYLSQDGRWADLETSFSDRYNEVTKKIEMTCYQDEPLCEGLEITITK